MRLFRGPCHYGRELLPDMPFEFRELFTRGIIHLQGRMFDGNVHYDFTGEAANEAIAQLLLGDKPCLISRFGTGEIEATQRAYDIGDKASKLRKWWRILTCKAGPFWWDNTIRAGLCYNAGVFPCTDDILMRFAELGMRDAGEIDLLGKRGERPLGFLAQFMPKVQTIPLVDLEPFRCKHPWTRALAGKRVLVVHSMPATIQQQYKRRRELFANPEMLPDFELITYRSVNSAICIKVPYSDWFAALKQMEDDIARIDFDIAVLSCGAYGLNLGAFIKRELKKKAVHPAGMMQLIFGIRGGRWDGIPFYDGLVTDAWCRPLAEDTPAAAKTVEGGCYW